MRNAILFAGSKLKKFASRVFARICSIQFSLGYILFLILGASTGLAVANHRFFHWQDGFRATCACWVAIGLSYDSVRIFRARTIDFGSTAQKHGLLFEAFSRMALACLFPLSFCLEAYGAWHAERIDAKDFWMNDLATSHYANPASIGETIFCVALLWALFTKRRWWPMASSNSRTQTVYRTSHMIFVWIAGFTILAFALLEQSSIYYLTHIAIQGVYFAIQHPAESPPFAEDEYFENTRRFYNASVFACVFVVANVFSVYAMAKSWRQPWLHLIWMVLCVFSAMVIASFLLWVYRDGIVSFSSALFECRIPNRSAGDWVAGGILYLIAAVWIATKLTRMTSSADSFTTFPSGSKSNTKPLNWQITVILVYGSAGLYSWYHLFADWMGFSNSSFGISPFDYIAGMITIPTVTVPMVLEFVATICLLRAIWRIFVTDKPIIAPSDCSRTLTVSPFRWSIWLYFLFADWIDGAGQLDCPWMDYVLDPFW